MFISFRRTKTVRPGLLRGLRLFPGVLFKQFSSFILIISSLMAAGSNCRAATLDAHVSSDEARGAGTGYMTDSLKPQYSLTASMDAALRNYPSLRKAQAGIHSESARITLAKTAYLPKFDMIIQEMRTTQNVVAGTIFPQVVDAIPIQSGTPSNSSSFKSVWNNNMAANMSWELWDFGLRRANVDRARAQRSESVARFHLTELDVAAASAETYLKSVAALEIIRAREAILKRMEAWQLVVQTLVDTGLRPGVDASRADAAVAEARIRLIESQRDYQLAKVDLAESMGLAGSNISIMTEPYVSRPQHSFSPLGIDLKSHPLALLRESTVQTARARVNVLDRTWYPKLWYHSAIFGRGSGVKEDPRVVAGGTLPQTANWTVGLSLSFPAFEYWRVKAERKIEARVEDERRAAYDLVMQQLIKGDERARVLLENARKIADETPRLVKAARDTEMRALERYKVGLTNIVEVAQAERSLAEAEVENAVADITVWRSILSVSYARGNLRPFIRLAQRAEAIK